MYTVKRQYEGLFEIHDEDGDRVGRVGRWMPGPMVSYAGPGILSPAHARAVADALVQLADEIDPPTRAVAS